jgi:hypothetical protein
MGYIKIALGGIRLRMPEQRRTVLHGDAVPALLSQVCQSS